MAQENWYVGRAFRFGILYGVALGAIAVFTQLTARAGGTIFDDPLRIAILAALGIGWPTFAPQHFDWLRELTFARAIAGVSFGGIVIWAPYVAATVASGAFGTHLTIAHDVAVTWALAGMLALTEREHPGDRKRLKNAADDAVRRMLAAYGAVYGPGPGVPAPVSARSARRPNFSERAIVTIIGIWISPRNRPAER